MKHNNTPVDPQSNAEVLQTTTMLASPSQPLRPEGKKMGLVAKIPVVIAEPKIQISVESTIKLEEAALEIKRIKKSVCLTQCELVPTDDKKSGKLFLSGFVRKNIEYATAVTFRRGVVSGDIRHTTVNVLFSCFAKVDFATEPDFVNNGEALELEILDNDMVCQDPVQQNFVHSEKLNEKVFCELVETRFHEKDIKQNMRSISTQFPEILVFDTFVEKMVIDITLKVLQKQQVEIPRVHKEDSGKSRSGSEKSKSNSEKSKSNSEKSKSDSEKSRSASEKSKSDSEKSKSESRKSKSESEKSK